MRYLTFAFLFLLLFRPSLQGQDLYTYEATRQFANYLFLKGDFEFASEEYARLLFIQPNNDSILIRLSQAYRKQGKYDMASNLFSKYRPNELANGTLENEYLATILFQKDSMKFNPALRRTQYLPAEEIMRKRIEFAMLTRNWQQASSGLNSLEAEASWSAPYKDVVQQASAFKPKKPWLAATYSAIIPGSGKMYSKNVKEGVTSLFFVTALGYQSYRAFKKRGNKAVSGWIYGGLSLGFYLGNIYGSHQSARNYNTRKLNMIYHEVDERIIDRY